MFFLNQDNGRIVLPVTTTKKNAFSSITNLALFFSLVCRLFTFGKMQFTAQRAKQSIFRPVRTVTFLLAGVIFFNISFAQNPIVTENQLPGTPIAVWGVPDFRDPDINGYATEISVNKGQTVRFKIDVPLGGAYTIKIYRIGYYGGAGAALKADLGSFTGIAQPAGMHDLTTGLVDCSNWSESAHWDVPSNAVSGFYIARIEGVNGSNHIVFTVRDDLSTSDLYFQTADATWQAYNGYGGNNLYDGTTSFPAGHAVKVSYNRPFFVYNAAFHTDSRGSDWYMNDAYPMIRWLERNGYDVTYTTSVDIARAGNLIKNHRVFVTAGHDEYWSKEQWDNVEAARNAGIHMAFFTGNDIYWKTRWEADAAGNNFHTMVCYKEGTMADGTINERVCGYKCDVSSPIWTGLWRTGSAYDAPYPENTLSGQISWWEDYGSIKVPYAYKDFRFWRNTTVANLAPGGEASLGLNVLGYEWDFEQFENFYPNGRMTMSSTTISGKTHKLSLYRHPSGALVFGAGTVQWSWGLDKEHYGGGAGNVVSKDMQQATANLFADMGVQPGTLQTDLVAASASTDVTPPASIIVSPADGSTQDLNGAITITGTASEANKLAGIEVSVDGGITWKLATGTTNWSFNWVPPGLGIYTIKVRGYDDTGNMEAPGSSGPNVATITLAPDLPVQLSEFTATRQENDVKLQWKTASEQNNKGFEIQRSIDGTQWINIGFVDGYGNSQSEKEYHFADKYLQPGKYYYRLRQVDYDGNSKLSKIVIVIFGNRQILELKQNYPNPYNAASIIEFTVTEKDKVRLMVYDQMGRPVQQLVSEVKNPGTYQVTMHRNNLGAGIYFYKLETKNRVLIRKMTIF
jgi:Bacterial Ig domain/Secretion system C-terminal sorting domain